jgi:hypothetical protein
LSLSVLEHLLVAISELLESILLTRFPGLKHGFFETLQALAGLEPVAPASVLVVLGRRTVVFLTPLNLSPNDVEEFQGFFLSLTTGDSLERLCPSFRQSRQDASVIGWDSVLERDLRRRVQILVHDDIQESLRGWARGFCEQVYVEVVTHLDPGIWDRS